jgi:hypothetical protein
MTRDLGLELRLTWCDSSRKETHRGGLANTSLGLSNVGVDKCRLNVVSGVHRRVHTLPRSLQAKHVNIIQDLNMRDQIP